MSTPKIQAGGEFPVIKVKDLTGHAVILGQPKAGCDWQMVVVYRGQHCPMCTRYLNMLQSIEQGLNEINIDLVAVSADSQTQLQTHQKDLNVSFPLYYGLSARQMQALGVYISTPRSEKETDHPFPEPGIFVINHEGRVQVVDISNNPFARPEVDTLLSGLKWIRNPDNNYPIRGTHAYQQ